MSTHDEDQVNVKSELKTVKVSSLLRNPHQPRLDDNEGLEELAQSIASAGLLNKIKVVKHPKKEDYYYIVGGHRRTAALRKLGIQNIQVEVLEEYMTTIPLIDNLDRVDLRLIEIARMFRILLEEDEFLTKEMLAEATGFSSRYIEDLFNIGRLHEKNMTYIASLDKSEFQFTEKAAVLRKLVTLEKIIGKTPTKKVIQEIEKFEIENGYKNKNIIDLLDNAIERGREDAGISSGKKKKDEKPITKNSNEDNFPVESFDEFSMDEENSSNEKTQEEEHKISDKGLKISHNSDFTRFNVNIDLVTSSGDSRQKTIDFLERIISKIKKNG